MSIKNFEKNNLNQDITKKLLEKLSSDIFKKYWIEKQKIEVLIKRESLISIENLKLELQNQNKILDNFTLNELLKDLNKAKENLNLISKNERINLIKSIENQNNFMKNNNFLEKKLPRKLVKTAQNPKNLHENILWLSLWTASSILTISESIVKIWIWIFKSPYDLYLISTWKAEMENIKKI